MIFSHKLNEIPFYQLINSLKILEETRKWENNEHSYIILMFDSPIGSAVRIDYNGRTKNISITCTEQYLEMINQK